MDDDLRQLLDPAGCRPGAAEALLDSLDASTGAKLPEDYREFLRLTNGYEGAVGQSGYLMLWAAEELGRLNKAYEVQTYAPGLVLFGSDGGGEAYGFDLRGDARTIVEVPFVGMDWKLANTISQSFGGFLESLRAR